MKPFKILLFIACAIGLLALIASFMPDEGLMIGSYNFRFPTLERIMTPKHERDIKAYLAQQEEEHQQILNGLSDSADYYRNTIESGDMRFYFPNDNSNFFAPLFDLLTSAQQQGRTIRILHYGDSQLEIDHITSRLRASLQRTFGGGGPGLVPIRRIISTPAVNTSASGALSYKAPYGDSTARRDREGHYGPLVGCFHLGGSSNTTYSAGNTRYADSLVRGFNSVRLLFDNYGTLSATMHSARTGNSSKNASAAGVGVMEWAIDTTVQRVQLNLQGNADIYGVMLDNGPGVAVDNIPMRGCSGQQFTQINASELADAYALMDVGLIILQFGGNSVPYIKSEKPLLTYASNLGRQIDRLHSVCPQTQILFIGPSDMSTTVNGQRATYPFLPRIIQDIRDTAIAHGAAFWSLYDAMGGENSMVDWVRQGIANSDYIHFTQQGADLMGDRLAAAFDNLYHYYLIMRKIDKQNDKHRAQQKNNDQ